MGSWKVRSLASNFGRIWRGKWEFERWGEWSLNSLSPWSADALGSDCTAGGWRWLTGATCFKQRKDLGPWTWTKRPWHDLIHFDSLRVAWIAWELAVRSYGLSNVIYGYPYISIFHIKWINGELLGATKGFPPARSDGPQTDPFHFWVNRVNPKCAKRVQMWLVLTAQCPSICVLKIPRTCLCLVR